jgi:hypothetical protein
LREHCAVAEIRNYTMNFSSGRPADLTCQGKLACTEDHRVPPLAFGFPIVVSLRVCYG